MLPIVLYPHPALRYRARPVERIDANLKELVRGMFDQMYEHRGIGLAATQVALPLRLFVLNLTGDPEQPDQEQVFINPEIVKRFSTIEGEEGCLSFPGLYADVARARKVRARAFNLDGELVEIAAEDLFSRAFQHELDHLDGKLFIDHLKPAARAVIEPKVRELVVRFRQAQTAGECPPDEELVRLLDEQARGALV